MRQRRQQLDLRGDSLAIERRLNARITSIRLEFPSLGIVIQIEIKICNQPFFDFPIGDRERDFDSSKEITIHPVCTRAENVFFAIAMEIIEA